MALIRKTIQMFTSNNGLCDYVPVDNLCDEVRDLATKVYMQLDNLDCDREVIANLIPSLTTILSSLNEKCILLASLQENVDALIESKESVTVQLKRQQSNFEIFQQEVSLAEDMWQQEKQDLMVQILSLKNIVNSCSPKKELQNSKYTNTVSVQTDHVEMFHDATQRINISVKVKNENIQSVLFPKLKGSQITPLFNDNFVTKINKNNQEKSDLNKKPKIELFCDDQGRGIAENLKSYFKLKASVFGMVLPGAPAERVVNSALGRKNVKSFTPNDYTIIIAGTNDVLGKSFHPQSILDLFKRLLCEMTHTKVIIATIPYRYDLYEKSKENLFIKDINNQLKNLVARYNNVSILKLDTLYKYFHTKHGFHINYKGKIKVSVMIVEKINEKN